MRRMVEDNSMSDLVAHVDGGSHGSPGPSGIGVVKQMTGEYACRSPRLYSLHWMCRKLARSLKFAIAHIPREYNVEANRLANRAARNGAAAV